MRAERAFEVRHPPERVLEVIAEDETLVALFPDQPTEIVARDGDRRTTRTRYSALGREGVATFHFEVLLDGTLSFEKECDGKVWRELRGRVTVEEAPGGARVEIEMQGKTKPLVPEFVIKGPMEDQLEQIAEALRDHLEAV